MPIAALSRAATALVRQMAEIVCRLGMRPWTNPMHTVSATEASANEASSARSSANAPWTLTTSALPTSPRNRMIGTTTWSPCTASS